MSWGAVSTKIFSEPVFRQLPTPTHKLLWLAGRLHCAEFETNGLIEIAALPLLAFEVGIEAAQAQQMALGLLECGLWARHPRGWHDATFLDQNPSHEVRERARERDRLKKRKRRSLGDGPGGWPGGSPLGEGPGGVPEAQVQNRDSTDTATETHRLPMSSTSPSDSAEPERSMNGHFPLENGDQRRRERIHQVLIAAISEGNQRRTPKARLRWFAHASELSQELAQSDLPESLLRRRALDFFRVEVWSSLGDSQQAGNLRARLLKPRKARTRTRP